MPRTELESSARKLSSSQPASSQPARVWPSSKKLEKARSNFQNRRHPPEELHFEQKRLNYLRVFEKMLKSFKDAQCEIANHFLVKAFLLRRRGGEELKLLKFCQERTPWEQGAKKNKTDIARGECFCFTVPKSVVSFRSMSAVLRLNVLHGQRAASFFFDAKIPIRFSCCLGDAMVRVCWHDAMVIFAFSF